jgi:hypothetical protein
MSRLLSAHAATSASKNALQNQQQQSPAASQGQGDISRLLTAYAASTASENSSQNQQMNQQVRENLSRLLHAQAAATAAQAQAFQAAAQRLQQEPNNTNGANDTNPGGTQGTLDQNLLNNLTPDQLQELIRRMERTNESN